MLTANDIWVARTDPRGECTCVFEPAGPGTFTRPVTDWACPVHVSDDQARLDAEHDFAALTASTVPAGHCTGCKKPAGELVPWAGERLCWPCTNTQLELMAKAILEDAAVSVGGAGLR